MRSYRAPLMVVAALAAAALSGCGLGSGGPSDGAAAPSDPTYVTLPDTPLDTPATPAADPAGEAGTGADTGPDTGTGGGAGGTKSGSGTTKDETPTETTEEETGPRIVFFRVATKPSCPAGTNLNTIPGTPVTLEWKVVDADAAAISVDGPGVYGTYEPVKSETFEFPCTGKPGTTQKHTYLLQTVGGGSTKVKEITVSARVNEVAAV